MVRYLLEDDFGKLLRNAMREAGIGPHSAVLNIACEFNRVPRYLAEELTPDRVNGLEINREIVAKDPLIKYCDVDRDRFPFPDATFDAELSVFGVEHFSSPNVFREALRTLKPNCRFMFVVPNLLYPAFTVNNVMGEGFAKFFYRRIMHVSYTPHPAYYRFNTLRAIHRVAREAGFSSTKLTFFGPSNILYYVRRIPTGQSVVRLIEKSLTNRVLFCFKPYILAELQR